MSSSSSSSSASPSASVIARAAKAADTGASGARSSVAGKRKDRGEEGESNGSAEKKVALPLSKQARQMRRSMENMIEKLREEQLREIRRRLGHRLLPPFTDEACSLICEYALIGAGSDWPKNEMCVEPILDSCDDPTDGTVLMTKCYHTDKPWVDLVEALLHPHITANCFHSDASTTGHFEETEYLAPTGMAVFVDRDYSDILEDQTRDRLVEDQKRDTEEAAVSEAPKSEHAGGGDEEWDGDEPPNFNLNVSLVSCGDFDVEIRNVCDHGWSEESYGAARSFWVNRIATNLECFFGEYYTHTRLENVVQFRGIKVPFG
jgi:hypothetical protein